MSATSLATSGEKAPGKRCSSPDSSAARKLRPLVGGRLGGREQAGHRKIPDGIVGALSSTRGSTRTFSDPSAPGFRSGIHRRRRQKPLLLVGIDDTVGQFGELGDVLIASERAGAQRVRVGDGELVDDHLTALERDLGSGTECLLCGVGRVVAAGPLGVFDGGDLAPQLDGVGPVRALGCVGPLVVPGAVLQGDGEDVHHRVVQRLAGGIRIELLRVVGSGADHDVGVVAGVQHDRRDLIEVADALAHPAGQVDRGLALVLRGVFLGVAVQDGALRLAGSGQRHLVGVLGAGQQPGDDAVLALPDRARATLAAHRTVDGLDGDLAGMRRRERLPAGDEALA